MPFADLMQWVAQSRKTGTLAVEGPEYSKKVYFREGVVVAAASEKPTEFLSYYLVGWSFVSEDELQELLDMQSRHGTMLGELLVIIGRLSREELNWILQVKTEETIYDLFLWPEADFRFLENILPAKKFQPLNLPVDMLVFEGVRRQDEWGRASDIIPEASYIPTLVRAVDVQQMQETELSILREINGTNSIEEIALACRLAPFQVIEFIFQGIEAKLFELRPPEAGTKQIPGFSRGAWRPLLKQAEDALATGDLLVCSQKMTEIKDKFSSQRDVQDHVIDMEKRLRSRLEERDLDDGAVPELAIPLSELTTIQCSPEEGFLLSRINGSYTIGQICTMVPGNELGVRLMVDAMMRRKVIKLKGTRNLRPA